MTSCSAAATTIVSSTLSELDLVPVINLQVPLSFSSVLTGTSILASNLVTKMRLCYLQKYLKPCASRPPAGM